MRERSPAAIGGCLLLALLLLLGARGHAPAAGDLGSETNLPIPRFVSLRSDLVNLRTGPGTMYPIDWVFVRRDLPVEVIAEFDVWRKIRDWQGTVGWVHQSMLDGRRTVRISGSERALHREPNEDAAVVARLAPGVIGRLLECTDSWCRIEVDSNRGWLKRDEFWGVYPDEKIN